MNFDQMERQIGEESLKASVAQRVATSQGQPGVLNPPLNMPMARELLQKLSPQEVFTQKDILKDNGHETPAASGVMSLVVREYIKAGRVRRIEDEIRDRKRVKRYLVLKQISTPVRKYKKSKVGKPKPQTATAVKASPKKAPPAPRSVSSGSDTMQQVTSLLTNRKAQLLVELKNIERVLAGL